MSRRRRAILLALIVAFAVVPLPQAKACSCIANRDPRDRLAAASGAFIGELVDRRETGSLGTIVSSGRDVIYTFEVAEVFKGDIGQRVEVHSAASGASCGFEVAPVRRSASCLIGTGAIGSQGYADRSSQPSCGLRPRRCPPSTAAHPPPW